MRLSEYLTSDHERLDVLLERALEDPEAYTAFRKGLLRHIAIEERVLFPILRKVEGHQGILRQLRLQHGALGALIIPRLTPEILSAIRHILSVHNRIEEGTEGVYNSAEKLAESPEEDLYALAAAIPDVPLSPSIDRLKDLEPVKRAVERAGFDSSVYFKAD